jgi:hypothetical protein
VLAAFDAFRVSGQLVKDVSTRSQLVGLEKPNVQLQGFIDYLERVDGDI